jgi:hypothetical protein
VESTLLPDAISLAEIFVEEHLAARNMPARGCATVENVINARLKTWLDVGVEKKRRRLDVKKGKNRNVLLRDNLRGWVDSAAKDSVKGAYILFFC